MSRRGQLAVSDAVLERAKATRAGKEGRFVRPLLHHFPELPDNIKLILTWEREECRQYVSGHPLDHLDTSSPNTASQALDQDLDGNYRTPNGTEVELVGVTTDVETRTTRNGNRMATFSLECLDGEGRVRAVPCIVFGEKAEGAEDGWVVRIKGVLDEDRNASRVLKVNKLQPVERW